MKQAYTGKIMDEAFKNDIIPDEVEADVVKDDIVIEEPIIDEPEKEPEIKKSICDGCKFRYSNVCKSCIENKE